MQLQRFAQQHGKEIKKDPQFRMQFQKMCSSIGVDPLASNKGFWGEMLGVGDFYFELAVQLIDICLQTRECNGGLIDMVELKRRLSLLRPSTAISDDDILRAIRSLGPLGSGFRVVECGSRRLVQSVPEELATDHMDLIRFAGSCGGQLNLLQVKQQLNWEAERIQTALDQMLAEGYLWLDEQSATGPCYWSSSALSI